MAGKCVKCGKYVCSSCAKMKGDKVYCPAHAGCFIATAAYGTPMAIEINTLRNFRDQKMEQNGMGKSLIILYYEISPPIARVISRSQKMRALVRFSLKPIICTLNRKMHTKY